MGGGFFLSINLLSYVILLLFSLCLVFVFYLTIQVEKVRLKNLFQKERKKIRIINDMIDISTQALRYAKQLEKYTNLAYYLSQNESILCNAGFDFEDIEISTLKELPDGKVNGFDKESFYKELREISYKNQHIFELARSTSALLGCIYMLNHPIRYRIIALKKSVSMHFLTILVKYASNTKQQRHKEVREIMSDRAEEKTMSYNFVNEQSGLLAG